MSEQRILLNQATRLFSYPRNDFDGMMLKRQPVSVTVRIQTPAQVMPAEDAGVAGVVDDLVAKASAAVDEGEEELAAEGAPVVGAPADVTSAAASVAIDEYTQSDGVYAFSIAYVFGTTVLGGIKTGTLTGTATFANGAFTGVSGFLDTNDGGTLDTVGMSVTITGPGMTLTGSGTLGVEVEWTAVATFTRTPNFQRGRRYLVGTDDILEVVHAGANDATTLKLAEPLLEDVADDAPILGFRVHIALTEDETSLPGEGLAIWTATLDDGEEVTWGQTFRIVRRLPGVTLTPTELTERWPAIRTLRSKHDRPLDELIGAAWDDDIEDLLAKKKVKPENVLADAGVKSLWALACLRRRVMFNQNIDADIKDRVEKRWELKCQELLGREDFYEAPQDAQPASRPETPPMIRTGRRLVR